MAKNKEVSQEEAMRMWRENKRREEKRGGPVVQKDYDANGADLSKGKPKKGKNKEGES